MSVVGVLPEPWRQEQAESSRLAWAFAISVAFHLLIFGGYETGKKLNWWQNLQWPSWLRPVKQLVEAFKPKTPQQPQQHEIPLVFVDVDPALASATPPKNADHYSSHNTEAANPEANKEIDTPKIDGQQVHVPKTEDVPRNKFPLQPAPAPTPPSPPQEQQEEARPKPTQPIGDLAMAKPDPQPNKEPGEEQHKRPRRLAEVKRPPQDDRAPGEKVKQEGGVHRRLDMSLFNTTATVYGAYDSTLITMIRQHWYDLLDERSYALDSRGKVVLQFTLHPDGRITDMKVAENTAGEVLGIVCQKAVLDPAPFPAWPTEMRRLIGEERPIQFTFYYD